MTTLSDKIEVTDDTFNNGMSILLAEDVREAIKELKERLTKQESDEFMLKLQIKIINEIFGDKLTK